MECSAPRWRRGAAPRQQPPTPFRLRSPAQRSRAVRAHALQTSDGKLCVMQAQYEQLYRVADAASFPAYLRDLESRLTRFDLPLGASVDQLPNGQIVLQVRGFGAHARSVRRCEDRDPYQMHLAVHTLQGPADPPCCRVARRSNRPHVPPV